MEARDSPAVYIAFDMLANFENLLGSPLRLPENAPFVAARLTPGISLAYLKHGIYERRYSIHL